MNETQPQAVAAMVDQVVARHGGDATAMIQILREIQERADWLSPEVIDHLQTALGVPRTKIEGVASFYPFLHLHPRGRYRILFSDNITDRMQGNRALLERLCANLWVEPGKLSEDGLVSVDTTPCTGMSDQGPALLVNGRAVTRLTEDRVDRICDLVRDQVPLADWPAAFFEVNDHIRRKDVLLGSEVAPGAAIRAALERAPALIGADRGTVLIEEMKRSNLRGFGGGGFSVGLKWEACRNAPLEAGAERVIVCNGNEGEPGAFKDRVLLNAYADLVVEGMTVAALAVGARRGILYLRAEYGFLKAHLAGVLERRRREGLLGVEILGVGGFDFDVEIQLGVGAYICGEESALLESLEGKRATPRHRPPLPVTHGYLGQPTLVQNVETFAAAAMIAVMGGEAYARIGTPASSGTKLHSISGDCERPGIYEYPFGVSIEEMLDDCGARDPQAVQVGGASGVTLCAAEFGRRIGFEDVPTSGAFMVFDRTRDMFEVARSFIHFFAGESCGFCTPCRVGTSLLTRLMDKLASGHGSPYDFAEIEKMNRLLSSMSNCGLGRNACNPILDTIAKFRSAYDRRLEHQDYVPAFDLDGALALARQMTGRTDAQAHLVPGDAGEGR